MVVEIPMTPLMIAALGVLMVATAFLSGLFGMAGGMILIGVLLMLMPLPTAMVLHAITQMASNGWRAFLWRAHIRWRPVFVYLIGCALALGVWSIARYVPDKPIALLLLGVTPFMARLTPKNLKPNPDSIAQGSFYGFICMGLMLMTGVSGPLMDTFFLGGNFGRREVVATKATCQVASHLTKLIYFGGIVDQAATLDPVLAGVAIAASMLGTTLARRILEAMSDAQFRTWANRLITTVAGYYILYGGWLLLARISKRNASRSLTASDGEALMAETTDPLVLDLVEWIAREPRLYSEVIETWRTSCPRLTIWEDAVDRGYVARETVAGAGVRVAVTEGGATFLRAHGRIG